MNYKNLGNTDLKVSTICLGTMTYGEQNSSKDGFQQMDFALDQGINFFDTAEIYPSPCFEKTYGSTEKIIGNWFKEKNSRDRVILASKVSGPGLSWVRGGGSQYSEKNRVFPNSVKETIAPLASVTTDILNEIRAIIPVNKTPDAI